MSHWAYGVTACSERLETYLPATLASLDAAGFKEPRLFIDGATSCDLVPADRITFRYPRVRTWANWLLSLVELYLREPLADRFALFQDDILLYPNLRDYLDALPSPENSYWNCITSHQNEYVVQGKQVGWMESSLINAETKFQSGRGAVALIFTNEGVRRLLATDYVHQRARDPRNGWKNVDGGVVTAMNQIGWRELVHNPSLVTHTGDVSTVGPRKHPKPITWRGPTFDARKLLDENPLTRKTPLPPIAHPLPPIEEPLNMDGTPFVSPTGISGDDPDGKLGDYVKTALAKIGVTEEAVSAWLGAPCGCAERRAKLNSLDGWARRSFRTGFARAKDFLVGMMG